jgi:hypothetical protein
MKTKTVSRINIVMMAMKNGLFDEMGILNGFATLKATAVVTY